MCGGRTGGVPRFGRRRDGLLVSCEVPERLVLAHASNILDSAPAVCRNVCGPTWGEAAVNQARSLRDLGVLVVEDDGFTRRLLWRLVKDLEVRDVWEASNGMQALEVLQKEGPAVDVVLCDLDMPKMGGLDLLHALRTAAGSPLADLPVIVLTNHREAETVKRAIGYGITGYLVKPVSKADLIRRLSLVLPKPA